MGIEDDRIELKGSDYERRLYELKKGHVSQFLVNVPPDNWVFRAYRPAPGKGSYIERMGDGTCRRWNNADEHDTFFNLV